MPSSGTSLIRRRLRLRLPLCCCDDVCCSSSAPPSAGGPDSAPPSPTFRCSVVGENHLLSESGIMLVTRDLTLFMMDYKGGRGRRQRRIGIRQCMCERVLFHSLSFAAAVLTLSLLLLLLLMLDASFVNLAGVRGCCCADDCCCCCCSCNWPSSNVDIIGF